MRIGNARRKARASASTQNTLGRSAVSSRVSFTAAGSVSTDQTVASTGQRNVLWPSVSRQPRLRMPPTSTITRPLRSRNAATASSNRNLLGRVMSCSGSSVETQPPALDARRIGLAAATGPLREWLRCRSRASRRGPGSTARSIRDVRPTLPRIGRGEIAWCPSRTAGD